jgi:hypothetical protein
MEQDLFWKLKLLRTSGAMCKAKCHRIDSYVRVASTLREFGNTNLCPFISEKKTDDPSGRSVYI